MPSNSRVLVVSAQTVVAALVGMLVELTGRQPVFAATDEQPGDAVRRLRPVAVILLDAEIDAARSDLFFALTSRHQIPVVVFGSELRAREIGEIAALRRIPWITLPPDRDQLAAVL